MTEILTAGALDFLFNVFFKTVKFKKKKKSLQAYGCVSTFGKTPACLPKSPALVSVSGIVLCNAQASSLGSSSRNLVI